MISFDEARATIARLAIPMGEEEVKLANAHRRILAAPVVAAVDSPPSPVSAMDGYAVRDADLEALPVRLPVGQEIFAGCELPVALEAGTTARIFTGAPVPSHADRVILQEVVERSGESALFAQPLSTGRNIRPRASDFAVGTALLPAGRRLGARDMVVAAGADAAAVTCHRRPCAIILSTGDELAEPGLARCTPGAIPESVSFGIAALVTEWGGLMLGRHRLPDNLKSMERAAGDALKAADIVIVTGGASVGEKDFAKKMFEPHDLTIHFSKVGMKPGKPVWLGQCGDRLVIGLPGNPISAMVTARLLLAPLIAGLAGGDPYSAWQWRQLPLAKPFGSGSDRETFVRAALEDGQVRPLANQDSGSQGTLVSADLLVRLFPHAVARSAGELVDILDF